MIREKSQSMALYLFVKKMFSVKRHFETEHENVLRVMYVNPPKDIKSSYFRKFTAVNWCNVLWLMV